MKIKIIFGLILFMSSFTLSAQMLVSVNKVLTQDTLLATVQTSSLSSKTVTASGQVEFSSNSGYVRILLSDDYGYDLLVYESWPLVAVDGIDNFNDVTTETIDIPSYLELTKVRVEIKNAELENLSVNISDATISRTQQQQSRADRIELINNNLRAQNALWVAGETSVSQMSYQEKKELFGEKKSDLQGYEYYVGGIFEINSDGINEQNTTTSPFVSSFDWRNRHGRNWLTSVKNQGTCGSCAIFAATGATEALVNLYYNGFQNLDLAEQQAVSCLNTGNCGSGWSPANVLSYYKNNGVVNETCFPYQANGSIPCSNMCSNSSERIKIGGHIHFTSEYYYNSNYPRTEESLKKMIIRYGPLSSGILSWDHAMVLSGFGTIKAGDIVYTGLYSSIVISPNDPRIGETYWIFKNSHGTGWGNSGWAYVRVNIADIEWTHALLTPVTTLNYTNADIACKDRDGDGYYFWGIGPKPATCPCSIPDEPDGDDSNPNLGPMNEYGHCIPISIFDTITHSQTWSDNRILNRKIAIPDGVILTITSTVKCNSKTSIIVQQGGKLIVDGGTLTSACDEMWQGIEVWGTRSRSQYPNYDPSQQPASLIGKQWQGELELKNGATIENALCAVALWKPGNYTTTGGILTANTTTFRNNAKSIRAPQLYRNFNPHNPSSEMPYRGSVRNCRFVIDSDYLNDETFNEHVSLTSVNGFNFVACDFSLDPTVANVSEWSCGIAAASSGFSVSGQCIYPGGIVQVPCTNYKHSTFEGFRYGIYATKGLSNNSISVSRSEFTNNIYGIHFENISIATIVNNEFEAGKGTVEGCSVPTGFGIWMKNSSGYTVRDNYFTKYGTSSSGTHYGIAIEMENPTPEEIYRNDFYNLTYANYVKGTRIGKAVQDPGVLYQCNTNSSNYADFFSPNGAKLSFCPLQGSTTLASGNTFSSGSSNTWHIYNGSSVKMAYYHTSTQAPNANKVHFATTILTTNANPCTTGNGGLADRSLDRDSLTAVYDDALENYNNVNTLYESLKDGGSTTQLQVEIQTAQPNDMWEIRAELLGISPHLSDTVLLEVADKTTVFSEAAIFDIMAANPDELKNLDLLTYLEQKENPLPEYMINILYQVAGGTTYKTALLEQMASYNHEKSRAANAMIRSFVEDTISTKNDSIRAWYAKLGGLESDKRIIASYLEENDFETALTLAESMPETYNFDANQQIEHERYIDILELHQTLFDENRYMDQLDENELAMLETFAQQSQGTSSSIARGILAHFYDQHFDSCPCTDEDNSLKSSAISPTDLAKIYGMRVETHPNPASTWIAFDYTLPENAAKATLTITDLQGRVVTTIELTGEQGQHLFDTRQLTAGTYLYSLQANDKQVNGKFAVAR